jgi:hypothetical protein
MKSPKYSLMPFLLSVLLITVLYFIFVFISLKWDPSDWRSDGRFAFVFFSLVLIVGVLTAKG